MQCWYSNHDICQKKREEECGSSTSKPCFFRQNCYVVEQERGCDAAGSAPPAVDASDGVSSALAAATAEPDGLLSAEEGSQRTRPYYQRVAATSTASPWEHKWHRLRFWGKFLVDQTKPHDQWPCRRPSIAMMFPACISIREMKCFWCISHAGRWYVSNNFLWYNICWCFWCKLFMLYHSL